MPGIMWSLHLIKFHHYNLWRTWSYLVLSCKDWLFIFYECDGNLASHFYLILGVFVWLFHHPILFFSEFPIRVVGWRYRKGLVGEPQVSSLMQTSVFSKKDSLKQWQPSRLEGPGHGTKVRCMWFELPWGTIWNRVLYAYESNCLSAL